MAPSCGAARASCACSVPPTAIPKSMPIPTGVRPLSFGGGIHHCLGAQLARIEGEIAFRRLAQRLPKLALEDVEHPTWRPTITLRGLTKLPARW